MSLEDILKPGEEVEHEGPKVTYKDENYNTYFTSENRLLLHEERGFISKEDDYVSWDFDEIKSFDYEMGGAVDPQHALGSAGNEVRLNTEESEEIMLGCDQSDIPDLVAEGRKRL